MIDSTVRLVGVTRSVTLTDSITGLMRQPGGGGWGLAPVVNSWFEGAGDGARLRGTRRTTRELNIPIRAFGTSRQGIEDLLRLLAQSIHDPFKVYVDFADDRSFYIDAVYDSGAEGVYGNNPEQYADMPLTLRCTDPYWTSVQSQSFTVAPGAAANPFLTTWAGLPLSNAVALGSVVVNNIGDITSRPTWTIHGPGTGLTITMDGVGFTLNQTLTASDVITIQYVDGGWTIKNAAGTNLYASLGTAPLFVEFPPGLSVVDVALAGTGPESFIQAIYPERREIVY